MYLLKPLKTNPGCDSLFQWLFHKSIEPTHFPPRQSKKGEKKGPKKSKRKQLFPESPGQNFLPTFELRVSQLFSPEPIRRGLRPLPPGLTSHDDERPEASAVTAARARDVAARPSVRAITFQFPDPTPAQLGGRGGGGGGARAPVRPHARAALHATRRAGLR